MYPLFLIHFMVLEIESEKNVHQIILFIYYFVCYQMHLLIIDQINNPVLTAKVPDMFIHCNV